MTIRSYGPGKFHKIIDEYVYAMTLDGGADREESYPEGGGWFGFVAIGRKDRDRIREIAYDEHGDQLTDDEEDLLSDAVAIILFERSDGIVEAEWYDDKDEAEEAWFEIEEEFEGDEEDE